MIVKINTEVDLDYDIPIVDYLKSNIEDFNIEMKIARTEYCILFKRYVEDNLDIDLDELDVLVIANSEMELTLDTSILEKNDEEEYYLLIKELKHHFGKSVFTNKYSLSSRIINRRLFFGCIDYYVENDYIIVNYCITDSMANDIIEYINIKE